MNRKLFGLSLVVPMLLVGQATAQEEERPRRDGDWRARMIEEFDADGDGQLSDEERQTARETMRERRGDRPGRGEARGRGDGRGRGEAPGRGQARPDGRGPREGRGPGAQGRGLDFGRMFDRFDADGDGLLNREEFTRLTERLRERFSADGPRRGAPGQGRGGGSRGGPRDGRGPRPPRAERPESAPTPDVEAAPANEGAEGNAQ